MNNIPLPQKGLPITLGWGVAVTERCNSMRQMGAGGLVRDGAGGFGQEALPANQRERRINRLLHPYEVRWAESKSAEGFWMIWLPSNSLFYFYGWWVDVRKNLEPAEGYPDGWYKLESLPKDSNGALYLLAKRYPKNEREPVFMFAASPGEMTDLDFSIRICNTEVDNTNNIHRVKQYVTSTIIAQHQGGSQLEIGENDIVGVSLDYVSSESDKDWEYHKYAIRLKRGRLKIKDGLLSVEEDSTLSLFVNTVPLSEELKIPSADYGTPQE